MPYLTVKFPPKNGIKHSSYKISKDGRYLEILISADAAEAAGLKAKDPVGLILGIAEHAKFFAFSKSEKSAHTRNLSVVGKTATLRVSFPLVPALAEVFKKEDRRVALSVEETQPKGVVVFHRPS